jgi:redox-sensitive bicupin YhaK (pirin superfamily)
MIQIRKSKDRGFADHGWLKACHTFSFSDYYDPEFMGYSVLRVINEDRIAAGQGFGTHAHHNMEIVTYIVDGQLQHRDSMRNTAIIQPGEIQTMSAGSGVQHSEFNPSPDHATHLLQIWLLPNQKGVKPGYGQKSFATELASSNAMVLLVSGDGADGSVKIHQDTRLYAVKSERSGKQVLPVLPTRRGWVQLISGQLKLNGNILNSGDGAAWAAESEIQLEWMPETPSARVEFLVFDLP